MNNQFNKPHTFQFPELDIPESKKDKDWHRNYALAIVASSGYNTSEVAIMERMYDIYNMVRTGEAFMHLQQSEDGSAMPAVWRSFDKIRSKIEQIVGEIYMSRGEISVKAINKDAVSRKLEEKRDILVEFRMAEQLKIASENSGIKLHLDNYSPSASEPSVPLPESEEDLEIEFFDKYKTISETFCTNLLQHFYKKYKWDRYRIKFFRDLPITGRCIVKMEYINGEPFPRYVNPKNFFFDRNMKDDWGQDAQYFGEIDYIHENEILERYDVPQSKLKEIKESRSGISLNNRTLPYHKSIGGENYYVVIYAEWKDTKKRKKYSESVDNYGTEHFKEIPENKGGKDTDSEGVHKKKDRIVHSKRFTTWRKAVIVGDYVVDWGEIKNQPVSVDNISKVESTYTLFFPSYVDNKTVSMTQVAEPMQELIDVIMYSFQLAIARAGGKGIAYDVSQLPDGYDFSEIVHFTKSIGITPYNSGNIGNDAPSRSSHPIKEYDTSLTQTINNYFLSINAISSMIDEMTGITGARMGEIQSANQAVGVTSIARMQSNFRTAYLTKGFEEFASDFFTKCLNSFKVAISEKEELVEKYGPIIGDAATLFLRSDADIALEDYGVYVGKLPDIYANRDMFANHIQQAVAQGQIYEDDALELIYTDDISVAIRKYVRIARKRRKEEQEAKAAAMQAQMQNNLELEQQKGLNQLGSKTLEAEARGQQQQMRDASQRDIAEMREQASDLRQLYNSNEMAGN